MILLTAITITILKSGLLFKFHKWKPDLGAIPGFFWNTFITYFGGSPENTSIDNERPYNIIVLTSLLGGVIIWIAYQSFLTAELSVVIKKYPFNDFESLAATDWK